MSREALQPQGLAVPRAPYSPLVVSGDLVFTAGQVAFDEEGKVVPGGIVEQARQTLANLGRCLEAAGCGFGDVVKVTAYLADMGDFAAYNEVYREYFRPPYPARTTVQAALAPGLLIEVEAIARRPPGA